MALSLHSRAPSSRPGGKNEEKGPLGIGKAVFLAPHFVGPVVDVRLFALPIGHEVEMGAAFGPVGW